jgi:HJR/Mrr/RecB family endonuclease
MLIKKTWALVTSPSQPLEIVTSDSLRILKFVQLAMAKSVQITLKESIGLTNSAIKESELGKKVSLVHSIIVAELANIESLCAKKQTEWLQVELLDSANEFINTVGLSNDLINETYQLERQTLLRFLESCKQHKTMVFNILHNIDYSCDFSLIKSHVISELKIPSTDTGYVFSDLNSALIKILRHD